MKTFTITCLFLLLTTTGFSADAPVTVPVDQDGVQRIEIQGGEYFFKPAHIVVKVNQPVELKVRKEALITPHDIVIDAPQAGIKVSESLSQEAKTIRFTPTKAGTYPFYCTKKLLFMDSHREKGMEGTLEVVE